MAELTIQQLRTANAPALPIAPDTAVIEAQQTERTAGTQSTGVTISEIVATGGRVVETAVAYETEYADSIVNATASNIAITIGDDMRVGSRKLVRRTAEYDGDAVSVVPPSGATFEGRASIELYGQYSFVEIERISATVFAIKDLKDEYVWDSGTGARIRRRWGQLSEKEIIGTTAATANAAVSFNHGLDLTKIVSATGMVRRTAVFYSPMPYVGYGEFTYAVSFYCSSTSVYVLNSTALISDYFSQPFTVVLHYREW